MVMSTRARHVPSNASCCRSWYLRLRRMQGQHYPPFYPRHVVRRARGIESKGTRSYWPVPSRGKHARITIHAADGLHHRGRTCGSEPGRACIRHRQRRDFRSTNLLRKRDSGRGSLHRFEERTEGSTERLPRGHEASGSPAAGRCIPTVRYCFSSSPAGYAVSDCARSGEGTTGLRARPAGKPADAGKCSGAGSGGVSGGS